MPGLLEAENRQVPAIEWEQRQQVEQTDRQVDPRHQHEEVTDPLADGHVLRRQQLTTGPCRADHTDQTVGVPVLAEEVGEVTDSVDQGVVHPGDSAAKDAHGPRDGRDRVVPHHVVALCDADRPDRIVAGQPGLTVPTDREQIGS